MQGKTSAATCSRIVALIIIMGSACVGRSPAQDVDVREVWETKLKLSLSTPKQVYLEGEPVILHVMAENPGADTLRNVPLEYASGSILLNGTKTVPPPNRWSGYDQMEKIENELDTTLKSGNKLIFSFFLIDDVSGPLEDRNFLLKEGTYKIKLVFPVHRVHHLTGLYKDRKEGDILNQTNEITITVQAPRGDDRKAFDLIMQMKVKTAAYWWPSPSLGFTTRQTLEEQMGRGESQDFTLMNELATKYPKSMYARYARFYMARKRLVTAVYWSEDSKLDVFSEDRLDEAVRIMNELIKDENDEVITPQVLGDFVTLRALRDGRFDKIGEEKYRFLVQKFRHVHFFLMEWGYKTADWK